MRINSVTSLERQKTQSHLSESIGVPSEFDRLSCAEEVVAMVIVMLMLVVVMVIVMLMLVMVVVMVMVMLCW